MPRDRAMRKLFHFDSPPEPYQADACVVSCYDARFDLAIRKFLKRRGVEWADHLKLAGGAKALASPAAESDRTFAIGQIRLSRNLHHAARILLFAHSDCGAYQGLAAFGGDVFREAEHHRAELARAADVLEDGLSRHGNRVFLRRFRGGLGGAGSRVPSAGASPETSAKS